MSVMIKDCETMRAGSVCDAPRNRRSAVCQRRHWCSHCCVAGILKERGTDEFWSSLKSWALGS